MDQSQALANNSVDNLPPPSPNIDTPFSFSFPPPAEIDATLNRTPPEKLDFTADFRADEIIWKQQYRTVSKERLGPSYKVDLSQAAHARLGVSPGQLSSAYTIIETLIRYGPHMDEHTTLVSHDTWLAMVYNLLRAATIGLTRTTAYTSPENLTYFWDLSGPFPPPQRHAVEHNDNVWEQTATLSALFSQHVSSSIRCMATMDAYRQSYEETAHKITQREVDVALEAWKEGRIRRAQDDLENAISAAARGNNKQYFLTAAQSLGLVVSEPGCAQADTQTPATPRASKRSISGSANKGEPERYPPEKPPPGGQNLSTHHDQGWTPPALLREPSPSPAPRSRRATAPRPAITTANTANAATNNATDPVATILESLTSRVETSLSSILNRIEALERQNMPPPPQRQRREPPNPSPPPAAATQTNPPSAPPARAQTPPTQREEEFTQVGRNGKAKRTYAAAATTTAATPANTGQNQPAPTNPPNKANPSDMAPTLSEVTIVRHCGKLISADEQNLRARAPDSIARAVISAIRAAAPGHPATPRSGRWGFHSKGNFIYTFNGQVTPEQVRQVEPYLMEPFPDGELIVNHGWSRIMLKLVPVYDAFDRPAGPVTLEAEVRRAIPALAKLPFAQQPKWLLGLDRIQGGYSSVTFAFSDPDRSITKSILARPIPMFGREIRAVEFIDRPPLVICNRCHLLGHQSGSQACKVKPGQVRCKQCGGAHRLEEHPTLCKRHKKHKLAGVCDCTPFCLNCHQHGHISTDPACLRRKDFYVRKRTRRPRGSQQRAETQPPNPAASQEPQEATSQEAASQADAAPADISPTEEGAVPPNHTPMDINE
ncbi:hypothetical protein BJV78DRAFT_1312886 [Lactifluus subvellereus]|nr:hypothetical protein BJV78DRAFT_1312886 [Lactifluus subvellereus]